MEIHQEDKGNIKQGKMTATHASDKGLVCTVHKESQQRKRKEQIL